MKKGNRWKDYKIRVYVINAAVWADVVVREKSEEKALSEALEIVQCHKIAKKEWKKVNRLRVIGMLKQRGTKIKKAMVL